MKRKKPVSLSTLVIYGSCAVIWIANAVLDFALGLPEGAVWGLSGKFWWGLRIAVAVLWTVSFFVMLYKYRKNHE